MGLQWGLQMLVRFAVRLVGSFQSRISQPRESLLVMGTFLESRWMGNWKIGFAAAQIDLAGVGVVL